MENSTMVSAKTVADVGFANMIPSREQSAL